MKWFVWWSPGQYDPETLDIFETERQIIDHLNKYAENSEFRFRVVVGKEVEFKPVSLATSYERAWKRS